MKYYLIIFSIFLFSCLMIIGCTTPEQENSLPELPIDRHSKIPTDAIKHSSVTDHHPPILHSDNYETPVPLATINTAGAEDSPFIPADEDALYFFFTPDVRVPVEKQVIDEVTGIYVSKKQNNAWQEPTRVVLQDQGKLSLDGCEFVQKNEIWFCTAREGYTGLHWAKAKREGNVWKDWKVSDFPEDYQVGELHFSKDWDTIYFHSSRTGGKGQNDIWYSQKLDNQWQEPINIDSINTVEDEGWPYLTPDGKELWFNKQYKGTPAVYKSEFVDSKWQEPELIISQFAGEPTLDNDGNIYFVHHYFKNGVMLEADIYVAYKI